MFGHPVVIPMNGYVNNSGHNWVVMNCITAAFCHLNRSPSG